GQRLVLSIFQFSQSLYQDEVWLTADPDAMSRFLSANAFAFILSFASIAVILVFVGIGTHLLQTGWFFLPEKIIPDFNRISPMRGLARIFSLDGLIRTTTGLAKIVICSAVVWFILQSQSE
ncbi:MAG: EscU/YscU/HrcU family type III secretion system export apparatus switch protein, partial [Planctomycetia bacterium]|nr:EscU/YscU/HrcU family type III secretion system export apparatus switch protein [Planctomycetia bacterium]